MWASLIYKILFIDERFMAAHKHSYHHLFFMWQRFEKYVPTNNVDGIVETA